MDEVDIWRSAKLLIEAHGEDAAMEAAMRADRALEDGYPDVATVWQKVMRAIEQLQQTERKPGEPLN